MRLPIPALILACAGTLAHAQGTTTPFSNFKHDSTQPVEITSDALEVDQAAGKAVFTGTVKVAQGELRMASDRLEVFYVQPPADPKDGAAKAGATKTGAAKTDTAKPDVAKTDVAKPDAPAGGAPRGGGIDHMIATGNVTLTTGAEAAEAEKASYVVATGIVEMEGDVLLTQGPNALSGEKLYIDLNAGTGRMAGRVKTIFTPQSDQPTGSRPGSQTGPQTGGTRP